MRATGSSPAAQRRRTPVVFVGEVLLRSQVELVSRWLVHMIHSLWTLMWTNDSAAVECGLPSSSFAAETVGCSC